MIERIYFFANCGDMSKPPYGGGEEGNRRTMKLLAKAGYDVVHIEKYNNLRLRNHFFNTVLVVSLAGWNLLKYISILMFGRRKNSIVHVSGYYGSVICFEMLLVLAAKFLGYMVVYEMRAGGAEGFYYNYGNRYCNYFDRTISAADYIFSQGLENFSLIEKVSPGKDVFYYPNYVLCDFFPNVCPNKPSDELNIIYFGRMTESKHIDVILRIASELHSRYDSTKLFLIGNFESEEYKTRIQNMIDSEGMSEYVCLKCACHHDELKKFLPRQHFFIFPSTEPREGHSNSLTEAMAWGIVPVASEQGFSRSVLDNGRLLVKEILPGSYVNTIVSILKSGEYGKLSLEMFDRAKNKFSEDKVFLMLKGKYEEIFGDIL